MARQTPDISTAESLTTRGWDLIGRRNLVKARPFLERALKIREKALGPDHRDTAWSISDLGFLLYGLEGNAAALPMLKRALMLQEQAFGQDYPDEPGSLNNLDVLLSEVDPTQVEMMLVEHAVAGRVTAIDAHKHSVTATTINHLGGLLVAEGKLIDARRCYERSLEIQERVLDPEHSQTAISLNNLASVLAKEGEFAAAKPLFERALAIREKVFGPDHPETIFIRSNIAAQHSEGRLERRGNNIYILSDYRNNLSSNYIEEKRKAKYSNSAMGIKAAEQAVAAHYGLTVTELRRRVSNPKAAEADLTRRRSAAGAKGKSRAHPHGNIPVFLAEGNAALAVPAATMALPDLTAERQRAAFELLVRESNLDNPNLATDERQRRAENLVRTYDRLRKRHPDYQDNSGVVRVARRIANRGNYQRRKAKAIAAD